MLKFWRLHDFVAIAACSSDNSFGEMNECDEPLSSRTFTWQGQDLKRGSGHPEARLKIRMIVVYVELKGFACEFGVVCCRTTMTLAVITLPLLARSRVLWVAILLVALGLLVTTLIAEVVVAGKTSRWLVTVIALVTI